MKISTKGRYGLKAMIDIAVFANDKCICLKNIAERQGISENYLEQIIAVLKKTGYVKSIRGTQGGYALNVDPAKITVGDILRTMEGTLAPVDCVLEKDATVCGNCGSCVTRSVWERVFNSINDVVDSITLSELADDYKLKNKVTIDV